MAFEPERFNYVKKRAIEMKISSILFVKMPAFTLSYIE